MKGIKYLIQFEKDNDDIMIHINQHDSVNRPNNADDYDLINDYISNNYGDIEYKVICIDDLREDVYLG